jgi:hypothetical protein
MHPEETVWFSDNPAAQRFISGKVVAQHRAARLQCEFNYLIPMHPLDKH